VKNIVIHDLKQEDTLTKASFSNYLGGLSSTCLRTCVLLGVLLSFGSFAKAQTREAKNPSGGTQEEKRGTASAREGKLSDLNSTIGEYRGALKRISKAFAPHQSSKAGIDQSECERETIALEKSVLKDAHHILKIASRELERERKKEFTEEEFAWKMQQNKLASISQTLILLQNLVDGKEGSTAPSLSACALSQNTPDAQLHRLSCLSDVAREIKTLKRKATMEFYLVRVKGS
jgi:hypothetical protein